MGLDVRPERHSFGGDGFGHAAGVALNDVEIDHERRCVQAARQPGPGRCGFVYRQRVSSHRGDSDFLSGAAANPVRDVISSSSRRNSSSSEGEFDHGFGAPGQRKPPSEVGQRVLARSWRVPDH